MALVLLCLPFSLVGGVWKVHLTGVGSATITAHQAGNREYNAAPNVSRTLTIDKSAQTVTFAALSYAGTLLITVLSDPSRVPDVAVLTAALRHELGSATG